MHLMDGDPRARAQNPVPLPPALLSAARDRALTGAAVRVLLWAHTALGLREFRRTSHYAVSRRCGLSPRTVAAAFALLCDRGYVEEGARCGRHHTYRVLCERVRQPAA